MKKNVSMNHHAGDIVRQEYPVGTIVSFEPKGMIDGDVLTGEVIGHMYINVLIIQSIGRKWWVSTFRVEKKENNAHAKRS